MNRTVLLLSLLFTSNIRASAYTDVTQKFTALYAQNNVPMVAPCSEILKIADPDLVKWFRQFHVILVSGTQFEMLSILGQAIPTLQGVFSKMSRDMDFVRQKKVLSCLGITFTHHEVLDDPAIDFNKVPMILDAIRSQTKPVILIGQSKGGNDVVDALVELLKESDVETFSRVRGIISIQSPFHGTPLVTQSMQMQSALTPSAIQQWFRLPAALHAINSGLNVMSIDYRTKTYIPANKKWLKQIFEKIPVVSVGTYIRPGTSFLYSLLAIFSNPCYLFTGIHLDGLVPADSAMLPTSDGVILENVDHVSTTIEVPFTRTPFNRVAFTLSIFDLLRQKSFRHQKAL